MNDSRYYERSVQREKVLKLFIQKALGVFIIALCVVFLIAVSHGETLAERDGTGAFIAIPIGLYFLFTNRVIIK